MDKLKNTTIRSISSKILAGSFGNAKYFGYKDKKLISLVEIKTKNGLVAYGESLVGTYSPTLYKNNLKYVSQFFLNKNLVESLKISQKLQINKFFYYSGILKSILASIEIAILNLISNKKKQSLAKTINQLYFASKSKEKKFIKVYSSAGSIKANVQDIKKDLKKTNSLNIDNIKIRLDVNKEYRSKIKLLQNNNFKFAIDLIANTYEKNRNQSSLKKFLKYIQEYKPLWIEECLNVNDIYKFDDIKKFNKGVNFSYGENFNTIFDFFNLARYYKFKYLNIDISHTTISDLVKIIYLIKSNNLKTKIIFHCWGGVINLHTSLEIASLIDANIEMVEFPIADFSLNNEYVQKVEIKHSKLNIDSVDRKSINKFYSKDLNKIKSKNFKKYEFKF